MTNFQFKDNIRHIKQLQRKTSEDRIKLLSQHHKVIKWCKNKLEENTSTPSANFVNDRPLSIYQINDTISRQKLFEFNNFQAQELNSNDLNGLTKEKLVKKIKQPLSSEKYFLFCYGVIL